MFFCPSIRERGQVHSTIDDFLDKLFPAQGVHLPYSEAKERIQTSKLDADKKEQMLFLLKKTSRGAGLDTAAQKWKQTYHIVDSRKFHALMERFSKLRVDPITLTSSDVSSVVTVVTTDFSFWRSNSDWPSCYGYGTSCYS